MDLHLLSDHDRRDLCRRELEGLEHWLRRLIHDTLSVAHGADYLEAVDQGGRRVIKKPVADAIAKCLKDKPSHRPVDAALLDDLVTAICNPFNWQQYFGVALGEAFPLGNEEARAFLSRLVPIRNKLSHANPISIHEAARVVCYTLDVIASLKGHYMKQNLEKEYNVPMIIRVMDTLGNEFNVSGAPGTRVILNTIPAGGSFRPGDRLSIEVEIDPSFERTSYRFIWSWPAMKSGEAKDSERITIDIENRHVRRRFIVRCLVISSRDWHKFGSFDDRVNIIYEVLPPLS